MARSSHRGVRREDELLGGEGEVHGVDSEPGLDLPRLVSGRGDEAPRRLLDTDAQHDVGGAVLDHGGAEIERRGARRARALDVDDRACRPSDEVEHVLALGHLGADVADEGEVDLTDPDAGVGQRAADGVRTELPVADVESAEGMDADAGDDDVAHQPIR